MTRKFCLALLVAGIVAFLCGPGGPAFAQDEQPKPAEEAPGDGGEFTVKVLGAQIARALPESLRNVGIANSFLRQGRAPGTQILVVLVAPQDVRIAAIDPRELQIDTFIDDRRTDLRPRADFDANLYGQTTGISSDGESAVVFLATDREPDPEAERLLVRGSVRLKTVTGQRQTEKLSLPLRVGETIDVGQMTLRVTSVALATGAPEAGLNVTLQSTGAAELISGVAGFDADDRPTEVTLGNRAPGPRPAGGSQLTLNIRGANDLVRLQFTYAEAVHERLVPFEVQVDLGVGRILEPAAPTDQDQPAPADGAGAPADAKDVAAAAQRRPVAWPPPRGDGSFPERREVRWPAPGEAEAPAAEQPAIAADARVEVLAVGASRPPDDDRAIGVEHRMTEGEGPTTRFVSGWPINPSLLFQTYGGTQLQLLVSIPGKRLVSVDVTKLRIHNFADDTGAQLDPELVRSATLRAAFPPSDPEPAAASSMVRHDGLEALLRLSLKQAPTRGAQRIRLQGDVPVVLAGTPEAIETAVVALRPGADIAPPGADFTATVSSVTEGPPPVNPPVAGPPGHPVRNWIAITILSSLPPDRLQRIELVAEDGRPLSASLQSTHTFNTSPQQPARYQYRLHVDPEADRVRVAWRVLDELQTVIVPIDVTAGIGF
jgi:hypothetical protein